MRNVSSIPHLFIHLFHPATINERIWHPLGSQRADRMADLLHMAMIGSATSTKDI